MADTSAIVSDMERRAERHGPLPEPNLADVDAAVAATLAGALPRPVQIGAVPAADPVALPEVVHRQHHRVLLRRRLHQRAELAGLPPPEAGVIAAVGTLGFVAEAIIMSTS